MPKLSKFPLVLEIYSNNKANGFFLSDDEIIKILFVPACKGVTFENLDLRSFLMTEFVFLYDFTNLNELDMP